MTSFSSHARREGGRLADASFQFAMALPSSSCPVLSLHMVTILDGATSFFETKGLNMPDIPGTATTVASTASFRINGLCFFVGGDRWPTDWEDGSSSSENGCWLSTLGQWFSCCVTWLSTDGERQLSSRGAGLGGGGGGG